MCQLVTIPNDRVRIYSIGVSIQGISPTDAPVLFKVTRSSAGTTGTAGTGSINKNNPNDPQTPQTSILTTWVTPPAAGTVIGEFFVHPQGGVKFYPPERSEYKMGGSSADYLAIEASSGNVLAAQYNCTIEIGIEE
jgi:hypothetical protein